MKKIIFVILLSILFGINGYSQDETNTVSYTVSNYVNAKLPAPCYYRINISIDYMVGGLPCSAMQTAVIAYNQFYVFNFPVDPANLISTHISGEAVDPGNPNSSTGCTFSNLSLTQSQVFNCCCYSTGHTYWTPLGNNTFNIKGHSGI